MTLQGALRFDRLTQLPSGGQQRVARHAGIRAHLVPETQTACVATRTSRRASGRAYDLFGNGKTSVKVNIGKYLEVADNQGNYQINNPASDGRNGRFEGYRFNVQTTRSWFDFNGNNPECNLMNPAPTASAWVGTTWASGMHQAPRQSTKRCSAAGASGRGLAAWSVDPAGDPSPRVGGGRLSPPLVRELLCDAQPRAEPGDFDQFALKAPSDPKLPDSGNYALTFYDVKPEKFGQVDNYYTFETDYAPARTSYWHGVDVNVTGRLRNGLTFQGGTSSGRGVHGTCSLWAALPELIAPQTAAFGFPLKTATEACHVAEPVLTQSRGLVTYEIPKIEVQLAGTFRACRAPSQA